MTKARWRRKIKDACVDVGTYRPAFDAIIETLAATLERRDAAEAEFEEGGAVMVVEHTNQGGATNLAKNPILVLLNDLNRDALAYWRDLGLTPAGLKKINDAVMKPAKKSALAEALSELDG